jgi:hypothetical protein
MVSIVPAWRKKPCLVARQANAKMPRNNEAGTRVEKTSIHLAASDAQLMEAMR